MNNKFKIIGVVILVILICVGIYASVGTYSEGYRNGHVVKMSRKGILIKTWEGELHLDCSRMGSNPVPWTFTADDAVVKDIEQASLTGACVNLHYKENFFKFFWNGESVYHVYKIEKAVP